MITITERPPPNAPPRLVVASTSRYRLELLERLGVPFAMGVGGSFDVVAGHVRRAPVWVQRIGCEWVYRVVQEPRRMWKRYLVGNTTFVWLTLKELLRRS